MKRPRTNTPLQALELLNDVAYVEAARALAQLVIAEGGCTPDDRIAYAFRRAIARPPTPSELAVLRRGLERYREAYRSESSGRRAIDPPRREPARIRAVDRVELAAYTATAGVILNLDETISQE